MTLIGLINRWKSDPDIAQNIVMWHTLPARAARTMPLPPNLYPGLEQALVENGIVNLYQHQSTAWERAHGRDNIVITTGTASGKSFCYNLPVLDGLLQEEKARALYLFPTKALAQDQLTSLIRLSSVANKHVSKTMAISEAIYDGDTPSRTRALIRSSARVILSNPDMLHAGILPHHTIWAEFLSSLRYVVIDEMHVYRGIFGSHVANVLRRLQRIAKFYGASPQFFLTSATIGNAKELAERLIEAPVTLIDEDGSGRGPRHFLIYNPPIVNQDLGLRRSLIQECVRLADDLLGYQVQTIIFGRTRRSIELMLTYLREKFTVEDAGRRNSSADEETKLIEKIRGYRGGYLPAQRREVEGGLRSGEILAVVATNALELGIDIGKLDAALLAGYPGTISATWQQAGRAGRGLNPALSILVTSADPLDQYLARYPEYLYGQSPEQGLINPDNLLILLGHLRCAAFELPFQDGEGFGNIPSQQLNEFLEYLHEDGQVHRSGNKYFWTADQYPAQRISLRSTSPDRIFLHLASSEGHPTRIIGEVDRESALWMVHPGAIYLHEAQTYFVRSLDLEQGVANLIKTETDYYTEAQSETKVQLIEKQAETVVDGGTKSFGELKVTTQVKGYRMVRWHSNEHIGQAELDLPPSELLTTGYWITLSDEAVDKLREQGLWSNSPNIYGADWNNIRKKVRERDGYRCQSCGVLESGREHDVHHKIPFRAFRSAEEANQLSNLVTLCSTCHRRVEIAVRVHSGLAGVGFALGHLAPLFLMCDPKDLGVHTDPQASITDGHPAIIIYDMVPAGIGFSERLYEVHTDLMGHAYDLVSGCSCVDGCPSCVGPGVEMGTGGKLEALALLEVLSGKNDHSYLSLKEHE